MGKNVITRLAQSTKFRDLVVGLGILITLLLLYSMRESFVSVLTENNFFGIFFTKP